MTIINSTPLLSGLAVQQKYAPPGVASERAGRDRPRTTVMASGDTVEISSEAWVLFRAQTAENDAGARPIAADDGSRKDTAKNAPAGALETSGGRVGVREQIGQLESEISGLEGEIAALEDEAETDELAAAVLRSKRSRLQKLQAKLTGLLAKSYQTA